MEGVGKEEGSRNAVGLGLLLHKEREMGVTALLSDEKREKGLNVPKYRSAHFRNLIGTV